MGAHPVYLSCLLSLIFTGAVRASGPAAQPLAVSQSEDRERRSFPIPAMEADEALERFLHQAGTAVVYVIEHGRGVQTNPGEDAFFPEKRGSAFSPTQC